MYINMIEYKD